MSEPSKALATWKWDGPEIFKASSGLDQLDLHLKNEFLARCEWKRLVCERLGVGLGFDAGLCDRDGTFVNFGDQALVFDGQLTSRCAGGESALRLKMWEFGRVLDAGCCFLDNEVSRSIRRLAGRRGAKFGNLDCRVWNHFTRYR